MLENLHLATPNTDKEIWREPGVEFPNRIFVTSDDKAVGISYGGRVCVRTMKEWVDLAWPADPIALSLLERVERLEQAMRETNPGLAI